MPEIFETNKFLENAAFELKRIGERVGESFAMPQEEYEQYLRDLENDLLKHKENVQSASRLLGWAQFNLAKGKTEATKTLIDKAIIALGGKAFYEQN